MLYIQIMIGIFFGLAIASVIARIGLRIHARRSLYPDDYIVLCGAMCLCGSIGLVYKQCDFNFLIATIQVNPSVLSQASADQLQDLLNTPFANIFAFMTLSWTAIFAVKFSFLVFFKKLITRVSNIRIYYWIVGIVNLLSWLFITTEPLILCRHPQESFGTVYSRPGRFRIC